jgi:hypothetical protein
MGAAPTHPDELISGVSVLKPRKNLREQLVK